MLFSTWPLSRLQSLPRCKQVFCPPVDVLDVGTIAASFAVQGCVPVVHRSVDAGAETAEATCSVNAFRSALNTIKIFNPEEHRPGAGVTVVDTNDIAALAAAISVGSSVSSN